MSYPKNVKFFADKSAGKVVCVIEDCHMDVQNYFDTINPKMAVFNVWESDLLKKGRMPDRFVGIATCGPDDEWDERKGRVIAYHRARKKYDISFFKHASALVDTLDSYIGTITERLNSRGVKIEKQNDLREKRIKNFFPET